MRHLASTLATSSYAGRYPNRGLLLGLQELAIPKALVVTFQVASRNSSAASLLALPTSELPSLAGSALYTTVHRATLRVKPTAVVPPKQNALWVDNYWKRGPMSQRPAFLAYNMYLLLASVSCRVDNFAHTAMIDRRTHYCA